MVRFNNQVANPLGAKQSLKNIRWEIIDIITALDTKTGKSKIIYTPIFPPLIMDINPSELSIAYKQLKNVVRTYGGFLEEHWPEELDTITASGRTAMFYTDKNTSESRPGLTVLDRRNSQGYKTFKRLYDIYKNNGKIFDSKTGKIKRIGILKMYYDKKTYEGYFNSFSIKENAENPFLLEYDFSFEVSRTLGEIKVAPSKFFNRESYFMRESFLG